MKKYRDPVPWRDIGRLATVLGVALIVYTVAVALSSPDQLFDWLNTLVATVLSVFSALVVGLVLFRFQTKEADAKKREELAALLEVELAELEREFMASRTVVPDGTVFCLPRDPLEHPPPASPRDRGSYTQRPLRCATDGRDARPRPGDESPQSFPGRSDFPGAPHGTGLRRRARTPIQ